MERDDLFEDAAKLLVKNQVGSTSLLQRYLKLGYNRAGRLIDQLEVAGIVGPFRGASPREVLVKNEKELEILLGGFSEKLINSVSPSEDKTADPLTKQEPEKWTGRIKLNQATEGNVKSGDDNPVVPEEKLQLYNCNCTGWRQQELLLGAPLVSSTIGNCSYCGNTLNSIDKDQQRKARKVTAIKQALSKSTPVIEQKEETSERGKIIDELVLALGEQEILSQKILTVLGREKSKPESKQLTPNPYGFLLGKKIRYRYVDWDVNDYTIWSTCTESDLRKFDDASIESIEFKP